MGDNLVVIAVGVTGFGKSNTAYTQVRRKVNRSTGKQRRCEVMHNELTSENDILTLVVSCKIGNLSLLGLYVITK